MPATINGTSGFGGNLTGNVTGNADTSTAAVTADKLTTTTGSAPTYACRAWVNFDGTKDSTGAASTANTNRLIRASGNVASVVRTSVGNYTVTFTTAMSDANYAVVTTQSRTVSGTQTMALIVNITASSFGVGLATTDANVFNDESTVTAAIFR
jgi:hypothetical protein